MIIYFTKSEANNNNALHWECKNWYKIMKSTSACHEEIDKIN